MSDAVEVRLTLRYPSARRSKDVLLRADADSPMSSVLNALDPDHPGPWFLGAREISPIEPLAESGIVNGCILTHGEPGQQRVRFTFELVVVGGPESGMRFELGDGIWHVGRSHSSDIMLNDPELDDVHFRMQISNRRVRLENISVAGDTIIEGKRVHGSRVLEPDEIIRAGDSLFAIREPRNASANIEEGEDGYLRFNRPARIRPTRPKFQYKVPEKPKESEKQRFPWPMVIAPLLFAFAAVYFFHSYYFLLFAFMSPVMALANLHMGRQDSKRKYKQAEREYHEAMRQMREGLIETVKWQASEKRFYRPSPIVVDDIATLPQKRIWERRSEDDDFLFLRVGSASVRAEIDMRASYDSNSKPPWIYSLPVGVNLPKIGVLGVSGDMIQVHGLARWLIMQIGVLHSPREVTVQLFTTPTAEAEWSWMKWLPHVQFEGDPEAPMCAIAADPYAREAHLKALLRTLAIRKQLKEDREPVGHAIVLVFDGVRAMRDTPGVAKLLREGPSVNIFAIGLDSEKSRMAQETKAEVQMGGTSVGALRVEGQPIIRGIVFDQVSGPWADRTARGIAPLKEVGGMETDSVLPTSVRFTDLINLDLDRPEVVLERWNLQGRSTSAIVGVSLEGPFSLDIQKDGPHALVAGTTGSGKSEFLQTLVASLALVNRPDALNFVLIDYKGASAFASCEHLPHTVGMVTNLDGHLTERALKSLDAEIERREHVLRTFEASDVDIAWERDPQRAAEEGLARLVIVVDEFAELSRELPDFVQGLVRVARVGRSLGVHMILGTQRPAGVITGEIRANTGLRVALRMEDKSESQEVLDNSSASTISRATPGRAYARLGGGSGLQPFQTARVAGRRVEMYDEDTPPQVVSLQWKKLGWPAPRFADGKVLSSERTDLHGVVALINKAAEMLVTPKPKSPWMPSLPAKVVLPNPVVDEPGSGVYAIEDEPEKQRQVELTFELETATHLAIVGSARAGRSTALRTIAGAVANRYRPDDCHIYAFDFGNGSLFSLRSLPHCGAVTARTEHDRIERAVDLLLDEIERRQELFSRMSIGDISEQRSLTPDDEKLPYILVLLDRWEGFLNEFPLESGSVLPERMHRIIREGAGVGIRVVISGDRALVNDRVHNLIETTLALRLNSRDDYMNTGIKYRSLPEEIIDGRAFRAPNATDVQFALLTGDASPAAQNAAIENLARVVVDRWGTPSPERAPQRVDALPAKISFDDALLLPVNQASSTMSAMVGVGGNTLIAQYVNLLHDGPFFTIAGQPKTGRSTAATVIAETILRSGGAVAAVCPRLSVLESLTGRENFYLFRGDAEEKELLVDTMSPLEMPVAFVVDDASAISGNPFEELIKSAIANSPGHFVAVVVGTFDELRTQLRGLSVDARKSHVGLLLSPQTQMEGDVVGMRLDRSMTGRQAPGRAVFVRHGEAQFVQVPKI